MSIRLYLIPLCLLLLARPVAGEEEAHEPRPKSNEGWTGLPGASYSPEHGVRISGAVIYYNRYTLKAKFPSRLEMTANVGFRGFAELDVSPDIWFDEGRWNAALITKLSQLDQDFFGIGNDTPESTKETYTTRRFYARLEVARSLPHDFYVAGVYALRIQRFGDSDVGGSIAEGLVPGAAGGILSGAGIELRYDTRDSAFFPTKGIKFESSPRFYLKELGSDAQLMRFFMDTSAYFQVYPKHILAVDTKLEIRLGDVPFDFMSEAGGKRLLRGLLQGRYRDKHYMAAQLEYRYPIYWRVRGVAFAGLGEVAGRASDFHLSGIKYSVGGGLRFALKPEEGIYLRLDLGYAEGETGAYLNLLEAF